MQRGTKQLRSKRAEMIQLIGQRQCITSDKNCRANGLPNLEKGGATGIRLQYLAVTTDEITKRAVTTPSSFDLIDTEYFSLLKIVPTGNLLGIDTRRIKNADKITSLFTKGEVGGKKVGDRGTAPKSVMYLPRANATTFSASPTQFMTLIPTVYNADTLGIRPDLIKRPISSWAELLNPQFKGRAPILNIPSIGIMDAAMVVEAMGLHKYADKGNMTKPEIDLTIKTLIEAKKAGQFRALWKDFNEPSLKFEERKDFFLIP